MNNTSFKITGHQMHEYRLAVPLDHAQPSGEQIQLFAREYVRNGNESAPRLVFFQGGPGHQANRPEPISGWVDRALDDYRVVLLDQRGTGLSSPITAQTITEVSTDPVEQAEYLSHFRAPDIVNDAELLREALGEQQWSTLGQSYGGFITCSYLSFAPQSLKQCFITAGLPGIQNEADAVYELTYAQTKKRNEEYFARYPQDRQLLNDLVAHLKNQEEHLPAGERLSVRRLLQIGIKLGGVASFDGLHFLLEEPFTKVKGETRLTQRFLQDVGQLLSYAANPLYGVMHETIYAQTKPTNWAAGRVRDSLPEFDPDLAEPLLTAEHIFPWQFEEDPGLQPFQEAAQILAEKENFGPLYDLDVLKQNEVPVAAAVYYDDIYVPRQLSLATADYIPNVHTLITNEYHHDGLRMDGANILQRLFELLR